MLLWGWDEEPKYRIEIGCIAASYSRKFHQISWWNESEVSKFFSKENEIVLTNESVENTNWKLEDSTNLASVPMERRSNADASKAADEPTTFLTRACFWTAANLLVYMVVSALPWFDCVEASGRSACGIWRDLPVPIPMPVLVVPVPMSFALPLFMPELKFVPFYFLSVKNKHKMQHQKTCKEKKDHQEKSSSKLMWTCLSCLLNRKSIDTVLYYWYVIVTCVCTLVKRHTRIDWSLACSVCYKLYPLYVVKYTGVQCVLSDDISSHITRSNMCCNKLLTAFMY